MRRRGEEGGEETEKGDGEKWGGGRIMRSYGEELEKQNR